MKNKYSDDQISLENDLEEINSFITDFNTKNGIGTPCLHIDLVKRSKKKHKNKVITSVRYKYDDLCDGLHGNKYICYRWYVAMIHSLSLDIKHGHFNDGEDGVVNDDFDDEVEEDDDIWDFKRKKKKKKRKIDFY